MQANAQEPPALAGDANRFGALRVVRPLPTDGARKLFLAERPSGEKLVLQVLSDRDDGHRLLDAKTLDEVGAYAALVHPNVIKVADVFSDDGRFVIALEYVDGLTLDQLKARANALPHPLDPTCWIYVASCVFAGLAAAHRATDARGRAVTILHRHVRPSIIHIDRKGDVRVGLFEVGGVAEPSGEAEAASDARAVRAPGRPPRRPKLRPPSGPRGDIAAAARVLLDLLAETSPHALHPVVHEVLRGALGPWPPPAQPTEDAAEAYELLASVIDATAARQALADAVSRLREGAGGPPVAASGADFDDEAPTHHTNVVPPSGPSGPTTPSVPSAATSATPSEPPAVEGRSRAEGAPGIAERLEASPSLKLAPALEREKTPASWASAVLSLPTRSLRPAQWKLLALGLSIAACLVVMASIRKMRHLGATRPADAAAAVVPAPASAAAGAIRAPAAPAVRVAGGPTPPAEPPASGGPSETDEQVNAATEGTVVLPASVAGHRIFVDGRVVGEGLRTIRIRCGRRSVRVGSAGTTRRIDVPCGGDVVF